MVKEADIKPCGLHCGTVRDVPPSRDDRDGSPYLLSSSLLAGICYSRLLLFADEYRKGYCERTRRYQRDTRHIKVHAQRTHAPTLPARCPHVHSHRLCFSLSHTLTVTLWKKLCSMSMLMCWQGFLTQREAVLLNPNSPGTEKDTKPSPDCSDDPTLLL
ncbi:unnamed protein product [Pleuronectes platessa]|uniref:Uncharacterized protein n=1 Tax=Pleuronectes platessa TaxID=8262 RepID=A0A9N7VP34_PLEPL|nr:unnamed protein product [Pleuronectes platessa]